MCAVQMSAHSLDPLAALMPDPVSPSWALGGEDEPPSHWEGSWGELEGRVLSVCGCAASHFLPSAGRGRGSSTEATPALSPSPGGCDTVTRLQLQGHGVENPRVCPDPGTCPPAFTEEQLSWGTGTVPRQRGTAWAPLGCACAVPGAGPGWDRVWLRTPECINSLPPCPYSPTASKPH